jgi:hypothetical protein
MLPCVVMDEGRKRVLAIVAGILVARHLKTTDDLFDSLSSPRTESLVAAVQWAERIRRKIDGSATLAYAAALTIFSICELISLVIASRSAKRSHIGPEGAGAFWQITRLTNRNRSTGLGCVSSSEVWRLIA